MRLLPRSGQAEYAQLLRDHDVGLALMYTPPPSLRPLGIGVGRDVTVDQHASRTRTRAALRAISTNLVAASRPSRGSRGALAEAAARTGDVAAGVSRGAEVAWSRDWERSFPDELLDRILAALRIPT